MRDEAKVKMEKVLLIAPSFYGYYKVIINELEKIGYEVKWYDDQITQSYYVKFLRKCNKNIFQRQMDNHINRVINETKDDEFSFVIVILGYDLTKEEVDKLRKHNKDSIFVYYTWDSVSTYPQIETLYKSFDKYYSFDDEDCKQYGFDFLPLFCSCTLEKKNIFYDYSTVMSYFPNKEDNLKKLKLSLPKNKKTKLVLYVKSKLYFWYLLLKYSKVISVRENDLTFNKLTQEETFDVFGSSKAVIDCPIDGQKGLTMRTFEVLGNDIKLITTNVNIKKYNFYSSNNIFVADGTQMVPDSFFDTPFDYNYSIKDQCSSEKFVMTLVGKYKGDYLKKEHK